MIKEFGTLKVNLRQGTTDEICFDEIFNKKPYISKKHNIDVERGETWLDIGANFGGFTLYAISKGAKVKCYEPEPSNVVMIKKNLTLNNFQAEVNEYAVLHNNKTTTELYLCKSSNNNYRHTIKNVKGRNSITVNAVNFHSLITPDIDAIKMDIEGEEINIFGTDIDWCNVKKLAFEYHFSTDRRISKFLERLKKLRQTFPNIIYNTTIQKVFEQGRKCTPKLQKCIDTDSYDYFPDSLIVICWR